MDGGDHLLHEGHVAPVAHVMLQQHREVHQPPLRLAELHQDVGARTREVEGSSIESHVMGVPGHHQAPVTGGVAPQEPVLHPALLMGAAEDLLALHHPIGFAAAPLPARREEDLTLLVVEVLVLATALGHRHALVPAEDKALVTEATLGAWG